MRRSTTAPLLLLVIAAAVALGACGSSSDDGGSAATTTASTTPSSTTVPATGGSDVPAIRHATFRPVLSSVPCSAASAEERTALVPDDNGLCYRLGPATFGSEVVEHASSDVSSGTWTVQVTIKTADQATVDALLDACYRGDPTCPAGEGGHGAIAVVADGTRVVSAPTIQAEGLAQVGLQVSGSFTRNEADDLASAFNA